MNADDLILLRERLLRACGDKRDGETVNLSAGDVRTIADVLEDVCEDDGE